MNSNPERKKIAYRKRILKQLPSAVDLSLYLWPNWTEIKLFINDSGYIRDGNSNLIFFSL